MSTRQIISPILLDDDDDEPSNAFIIPSPTAMPSTEGRLVPSATAIARARAASSERRGSERRVSWDASVAPPRANAPRPRGIISARPPPRMRPPPMPGAMRPPPTIGMVRPVGRPMQPQMSGPPQSHIMQPQVRCPPQAHMMQPRIRGPPQAHMMQPHLRPAIGLAPRQGPPRAGPGLQRPLPPGPRPPPGSRPPPGHTPLPTRPLPRAHPGSMPTIASTPNTSPTILSRPLPKTEATPVVFPRRLSQYEKIKVPTKSEEKVAITQSMPASPNKESAPIILPKRLSQHEVTMPKQMSEEKESMIRPSPLPKTEAAPIVLPRRLSQHEAITMAKKSEEADSSKKKPPQEQRAPFVRISRKAPPANDHQPAKENKPPPTSVDGETWSCPLCSKQNENNAIKCACCGRFRDAASTAAQKLWAGPQTSVQRPKPPPKGGKNNEESETERERRLMYYRRRPPPQRPKGFQVPRPTARPPAHAVVHNRHYTSRYHEGEQHLPLRLQERERRLEHLLASRKGIVSDGVVLSEFCTVGGAQCAVTVIQREWRAIVHAVDLRRGEEYSASSELHARYVESTAPDSTQKIALYRELVSACAFRSTLQARHAAKPSKKFVAFNNEKPSSSSKSLVVDDALERTKQIHQRIVLTSERVVLSGTLMRVSAIVCDATIVEIRLEDPATQLKTKLTFPLGAVPGLAAALRRRTEATTKNDSIPPILELYAVRKQGALVAMSWESPWARGAAQRASQSKHKNELLEPEAYRIETAMAVEFACSELVSTVVQENLETMLRMTPSTALMTVMTQACRQSIAAVILQSIARRRLAVLRWIRLNHIDPALISAASRMQARRRARAPRREYLKQARARETIRRAWRVHSARRQVEALRLRRDAASLITSRGRTFLAQRNYQRKKALADDARLTRRVVAIAMAKQRERQRELARLHKLRTSVAARRLQRFTRETLARIEDKRVQQLTAVNTIQPIWRGSCARRRARLLRTQLQQTECALRIESAWRCRQARMSLSKKKKALAQRRAALRIELAWSHCKERRDAVRVMEERRQDLLRRAAVAAEAATEADFLKEQEELNRWAEQKASQERVIAAVFADRAACNALSAAKRAVSLAIKSHRAIIAAAKYDAATRIAMWYRRGRRKQRADAVQQAQRRCLIRIQAFVRGSSCRKVYLFKKKRHYAAICIQRHVRGAALRWYVYEPRKKIHSAKRHHSVIRIQSVVRGFRSRRHAAVMRASTKSQQCSATLIQSCLRAYIARRSYRATRAAITLQRLQRGQIGRKIVAAKIKVKDDAILSIQCATRIWLARRTALSRSQQLWRLRQSSAVRIQSAWRRVMAYRHSAAIRAEWQALADAEALENEEAWRIWAASIIQAWWRNLVTTKAAANEEAWRQWAASVLQTWFRRLVYKWQLREQRELDRQAYEAQQRAAIYAHAAAEKEEEEDDDAAAGSEEEDDTPFEFNPDDRRDVHEAFQWVRHRRRDKLKKFCQAGFDPDLRNEHGQSLAMVAAQNNSKAMLKILYRHGVHINEVDYRGNSALHYACQFGYMQLAEYMVRKLGADDTIVNNQKKSCYLAVRRHSNSSASGSDAFSGGAAAAG